MVTITVTTSKDATETLRGLLVVIGRQERVWSRLEIGLLNGGGLSTLGNFRT